MQDVGIQARRQSVAVQVGNVTVGGGAPIVVQSMTNTLTSDAAATLEQIRQLEEAGAAMGEGAEAAPGQRSPRGRGARDTRAPASRPSP